MDELDQLEVLSLVSKLQTEINNYMGVNDKTLAEFIIAQRTECDDFPAFKARMDELGAGFPPNLVESIERLCTSLHPELKKRHPAAPPLKIEKTTEEKAQVFKGLALPDRQAEKAEIEEEDDALVLLGQLGAKATASRREKRQRSRSPRSLDYYKEKKRERSRDRYDDRHDSRDNRKRHRDRGQDVDPERGRSEERDRQRRRHRSRSQDNGPELDVEPAVGKVYDGEVYNVKDFGAFVNLTGIKGSWSGLVHVSQLGAGRRVNHPSDVVETGQPVKVKVTKFEPPRRVTLTMRDVNQGTGAASFGSGANSAPLGGRSNDDSYGHDSIAPGMLAAENKPARQKKRLTSPERWEIRQLIASGVAKASDFPDFEEEYNATLQGDGDMELEVDVDIEVREEEPPFLVGQTKQSLELSPIRVIKAPDGSMNRAAVTGSSLVRDRKEIRRQEQEAAKREGKPKTENWNDPMVSTGEFASELRAVAAHTLTEDSVPEWKRVVRPQTETFGKRTNLSIKVQRESLPVFRFRNSLIEAIKNNQILIVVGETGSGKTTQLTQYLAEAGFADRGIVGCTQPRRVAAMSVAKRVAEEVGCRLGEEVGYTIRFEDCTSHATRIKYMTDGMLQREILIDPELRRYSVIMLDEAHERTIATDVLFALLKKAVKKRPDLKIIVTSATLDAEKFSTYFNECPIFTIPGRTFPVEILYSREPEEDYMEAALMTVMQIHLAEPPGDILLFLTGQEEIDTACEILYERMKALGPGVPELIILPVYSALPSEMQSRIFEKAPPGSRKVVIATNIAETSITIDEIFYVIDPGFVKQNAYDPKLGMDSLVVTPISQAQANQRSGRAGRTGPGKCFRLYTEAAYQTEMLPTTIPEIQRQNLSNTILMLKAMGINDLIHFDFMDPPPINTLLTALDELYALAALDDEGFLTRLGRKMADFPMEPSLAKVLIAAVDKGCSDEMLSIVAMLNLPNVFYRPKEKQQVSDQKKAKFHDPAGDHLTLLNVYNSWRRNGCKDAWCFENFVQARSMRRAKDVRDQIVKIMERYRHPVVSCGSDTSKVRQALCTGFFRNAARKDPQEGYKTLMEGTPVYMHPSSALFGKQAEWVIYHTLVLTTREYMHCTTSIEPKWLVEAAPTVFRVAPTDRLSKRRQQERIQPLFNRYATGQDDWRLSAQRKGGKSGGGGTWG